MTVEERRRRRFSEEFRIDIVKRLEDGEFTITNVSKIYQVKTASVRRWIKKYGAGSYKDKIVISYGEELDTIKTLENEVKKLKEVIANQQIELFYFKTAKQIAEQRLGKDFEKKA